MAALTGLALLPGCSGETRNRLAGVQLRDVRLDTPPPSVPVPRPADAELRRRAVVAGSVAALAALDSLDLAPEAEPAPGLTPRAARQVHDGHLTLLGGPPTVDPLTARTGSDPGSTAGPGTALPPGPASPPESMRLPLLASGQSVPAVLGSVAAAALRVSLLTAADPGRSDPDQDDLDQDDPDAGDSDVAVLYARIAAARQAQAIALGAPPLRPSRWPDGGPDATTAEALQLLLGAEHAAAWSLGVVRAWRDDDAVARETRRREDARDALAAAVEAVGLVPVAPRATYDTRVDGAPVDGPEIAGRLVLRLLEHLSARTLDVLTASVRAGEPDWLRVATGRLAEEERARWSWGGAVARLPGR